MHVTDVPPLPIDRPDYAVAVEIVFLLLALISFVRVATYTAAHARHGTLVGGRRAPLSFPAPPLAGGLFALSVLLFLFGQWPAGYMLLVVGGIWIFLAAAGRSAEFQFGLARVSLSDLVRWSLLVCGAYFFVEIPLSHVVDRMMTLFRWPHPDQQAVEIFRHYDKPAEIFFFMLQAVLISPVIEELFFRGFLFSFLKRYTSIWGALILSGGVFAFAHANLGSALQLWLLGVVLGVAYENSGSLLLPMGIHGCFNFITALSLLADKGHS